MTMATPMRVEHATQTAAGPVPVRLVVTAMFVQSLKLATTDLPMLVAVAMPIARPLVRALPAAMAPSVQNLSHAMMATPMPVVHATRIAAVMGPVRPAAMVTIAPS